MSKKSFGRVLSSTWHKDVHGLRPLLLAAPAKTSHENTAVTVSDGQFILFSESKNYCEILPA